MGGCKISVPARPGKACKCKSVGPATCSGDTINCENPNHPKCVKPDASYDACALGFGDCEGYEEYPSKLISSSFQ